MERVFLNMREWKETKYGDVFVNSGTCYPGVVNVFPAFECGPLAGKPHLTPKP